MDKPFISYITGGSNKLARFSKRANKHE